jgi:putative toxin-antitoxin system antitoxin component (TIGR02293 family)
VRGEKSGKEGRNKATGMQFFNQNVIYLGMAKSGKKPKPYFEGEDEHPFSVAEEAAVHYESMRVILGGNKSILRPITGDEDLVSLSRKGVHKSSLKSLSNYLGITMEVLSGIFHSSYRNIQRKEEDELLDVYKSEQAIEIAQVVSKCLDIFGTKENMQQWFSSSVISLGGKRPIDLLDTSFGIRMIFNTLHRLEHGVYS